MLKNKIKIVSIVLQVNVGNERGEIKEKDMTKTELKQFGEFLKGHNLSDNTVYNYSCTVSCYFKNYASINERNLGKYKLELLENYKPKSINLKLQAIKKFAEFKNLNVNVKFIKIQQKYFLENVISNADYMFLKNKLKKDGVSLWYFIVRFLAATGARISELLKIKAEHIFLGYLDLYGKGGKVRRIYIPKKLQTEAIAWLNENNVKIGYVFLNAQGQVLTSRGVAGRLKYCLPTLFPPPIRKKLFGKV